MKNKSVLNNVIKLNSHSGSFRRYISLGSSVWPLCIRQASLAFLREALDVG